MSRHSLDEFILSDDGQETPLRDEEEKTVSDRNKKQKIRSADNNVQREGSPYPITDRHTDTAGSQTQGVIDQLKRRIEKLEGKKRKAKRSSSSSSSRSSSPSTDSSVTYSSPRKSRSRSKGKKRARPNPLGGPKMKRTKLDMTKRKVEALPDLETNEMEKEEEFRVDEEDVLHNLLGGAGTDHEIEDGECEEDEDDMFKTACAEYGKDEEMSDPLPDTLAKFIAQCFGQEMGDEKIREKFDMLRRPENCPSLTVRLTNKDIWGMLRHDQKKVDAKFTTAQRFITKAVTALAFGAKEMKDMKDQKTRKALAYSLDAIALLGTVQQKITAQRKMTQKPALPFDIREICHMPSDGTEWLYGDNFKQNVKDAKEQKRLSMTNRVSAFSYPGTSGSLRRDKRPFLGRGNPRVQSTRGRGNWTNHPRFNKAKRAKPYRD